MSQLDPRSGGSATPTPTAPEHGKWRAVGLLGLALGGLAAVASVLTCSDATIPPGQTGVSNGLCTYPRGCYVVNLSGPSAGQCDDCSSTSRCRVVYTPENPGDYQSVKGTWMTASGRPAPTDWQAICGLYPAQSAAQTAICAAPAMVCVARGVVCNGYCVHPLAQGSDGGTGDLGAPPAACLGGLPVPPQRRIGATDGGTQTYCPLTDDVCCAAAPGPDGGPDDGGAGDGGGATDGAAAELGLGG